jgi:hypothetical protein
MNKFLTVLFLLVPVSVWACPNCNTGLGDANKPPYTLIILGIFVALTYVPFYLLFRAAKTYDPKNTDGNE